MTTRRRRRRDGAPLHDVLLAVDEIDAAAAVRTEPGLASYDVITRLSGLYGLEIGEFAITEAAARGMGQETYLKVNAYLHGKARDTRRIDNMI